MQKYELSREMRKVMAQDPAAVKAALCVIANKGFSTNGKPPQGIFKAEGGIVVNNRPIVIHSKHVVDDYRSVDGATPEEQAVVDAITEVAGIVNSKGVKALRVDYGQCITGNSLQSFLGLDN
jgi:hypothetical protein